MLQQAGFSKFPEKTDEFLEMCKALKAKSKPAGFALGKAVGDGNNFAHWIVWSHGGKMVDEGGKVVINSPETIKALQYARELYQTFIPGTESWLDINNNRVFLSGDISVTANGVSLYYSAKNDPKMADLAKDIRSTVLPTGPVGQPVELHQTTSAVIFRYSKYPECGAGLSAVHARQAADGRVDLGFERILLPAAERHDRQPDLDRRPGKRALQASVLDASPQRLCRSSRIRVGRDDGGLRDGRHGGGSSHRTTYTGRGCQARRATREPLLPRLSQLGAAPRRPELPGTTGNCR